MDLDLDLVLVLSPEKLNDPEKMQNDLIEQARKKFALNEEAAKQLFEFNRNKYDEEIKIWEGKRKDFEQKPREDKVNLIADTIFALNNLKKAMSSSKTTLKDFALETKRVFEDVSKMSDEELMVAWEAINSKPNAPELVNFETGSLHILIVGELNKECSENIQAIIDRLKENGYPVKGLVLHKQDKRQSVGEMKNVGYIYSPEEIAQLEELNKDLEGQNISLKFCEDEINEENMDVNQHSFWTLKDVLAANNNLEHVVEVIRSMNLSPFEAALIIHNYCAHFKYNESEGFLNSRTSREVVDIFKGGKIVCVGYSQLYKAIADKLNMPGLRVELNACRVVRNGKNNFGGHANNIVYIDDKKYNIRGEYAEDSCWDSIRENKEKKRTLAFCLYPQSDKAHFSGFTYYPTNDLSMEEYTSFVRPKVDAEENKSAETKRAKRRSAKRRSAQRHGITPELEEERAKFFEHARNAGEAIPLSKFAQALYEIQLKSGKTEEESVAFINDICNRTRKRANKVFSPKAENCFVGRGKINYKPEDFSSRNKPEDSSSRTL